MKELKFIQACPDDTYYTWQVHLWLESLRELGHSDKAVNLIFTPHQRAVNTKWKEIMDLYPEAEFHFYDDKIENISRLIGIYIPIIRPFVLWKYFEQFPKNNNNAIFYCDSDILFTKDFNIEKLLEDDVCYLSDTNSYINASYFDSKIKDVILEKLEMYKTRDILSELTKIIGVSREIAESNNLNSGGAQYLLKDVDAEFWKKVMTDCITIRLYLQEVNRQFFTEENKGFQSWCADMWSVLWNLWYIKKETKVVKEMDFSWSTDPISVLDTKAIFHNAGVTGPFMNGVPMFYKGKYHQGASPFEDEHVQIVINNEQAQKTCNWYYANKLLELKNKYYKIITI